LTFIEQCKTPTLVLHGDKDERVPLANGRSWHRGLKFLGIETEMVVYPGGGHLLTRRDHQLDAMRRVLAWYERHLRDP
jgi:dipeptidyl aminopeptidase/acylaminoacyl peptidase